MVQEIRKLANYWKFSQVLAELRHTKEDLFANLKLQSVEPYQSTPIAGTRGRQRRFVRAEVQMIVYYETSSTPIWPRVIGASKPACFLCDAFIQAHQHFRVSKTHRKVYHLWTVPDLKGYSNATLRCLRDTLVRVDRNILEKLEIAQKNKSRTQFPRQNFIDLNRREQRPAFAATIDYLMKEQSLRNLESGRAHDVNEMAPTIPQDANADRSRSSSNPKISLPQSVSGSAMYQTDGISEQVEA